MDNQLQGDITPWMFSILLVFQVLSLMRSPEKDGSELTMNSFPTLGQTMSSRHQTRMIRGVHTCCSIGEYEWFGWLSSNEGYPSLHSRFIHADIQFFNNSGIPSINYASNNQHLHFFTIQYCWRKVGVDQMFCHGRPSTWLPPYRVNLFFHSQQ